MTGPKGNSEFCFPSISVFPSTLFQETLRFWETEFIISLATSHEVLIHSLVPELVKKTEIGQRLV